MIEFDKVSLVLRDKKVLWNFSFKIEKSQSVLLVGNSGAGKSTILKLILGLIKPSAGSIYIQGKDITQLPEKELMKIRQNFGMVFQEGALFDSLTVEENVGFFLRESQKLSMEVVNERVSEKLRYLGLEDYLHYYPSQLSGGMKKRVALARAMVSNPQVLLYDEPTAGLDPFAAKRVVGMIDELRKTFGVTSLIVSHEIHYFLNSADRMIVIRQGQNRYDGVPDLSITGLYEEVESSRELSQEVVGYGIV